MKQELSAKVAVEGEMYAAKSGSRENVQQKQQRSKDEHMVYNKLALADAIMKLSAAWLCCGFSDAGMHGALRFSVTSMLDMQGK